MRIDRGGIDQTAFSIFPLFTTNFLSAVHIYSIYVSVNVYVSTARQRVARLL
jgi:hypothetical protein